MADRYNSRTLRRDPYADLLASLDVRALPAVSPAFGDGEPYTVSDAIARDPRSLITGGRTLAALGRPDQPAAFMGAAAPVEPMFRGPTPEMPASEGPTPSAGGRSAFPGQEVPLGPVDPSTAAIGNLLTREGQFREQGRQAAQGIGALKSAALGTRAGASMNFDDELAGVSRASGLPDWTPPLIAAPVGAARIGLDALGVTDGRASRDYADQRDYVRGYQDEAFGAHPVASLAGQIAGGLALPAGAAAQGAGLVGQAGRGLAIGAGYGGVAGAGSGEGGEDRAERAAIGATLGGTLGGVLPGIASMFSRSAAPTRLMAGQPPSAMPAQAGRSADDVMRSGATGSLEAPAASSAIGPYGAAANIATDDAMDAIRLGIMRNLEDPSLGRSAGGLGQLGQPSFGPYGRPSPMAQGDAMEAIRAALTGPLARLGDPIASRLEETGGRIMQDAATKAQSSSPFGRVDSSQVASRAPPMYDPVPRSARPIEADYPAARWPDGPPVNASGRLTHDIDGRPLVPGARIVGRGSVGGADEALTPAELDAIATTVLGAGPESVARRSIPRGGVGAYVLRRSVDGSSRRIFTDAALTGAERESVVAHEFGHAIDEIAGDFVGAGPPMPFAIPQKGIAKELAALYNETNNPTFRSSLALRGDRADAIDGVLAQGSNRRNFTPGNQGYKPEDAPPELMAEAVRAYMADPNAMKAAYPKTAARIREAVNGNPTLSPHLQFNSLAGALGLGAGAMAVADNPDDVLASPLARLGDPIR